MNQEPLLKSINNAEVALMLWPFHSLGNLFVAVNVCLLVEALVLGSPANLLYVCIVLHLTVFFLL